MTSNDQEAAFTSQLGSPRLTPLPTQDAHIIDEAMHQLLIPTLPLIEQVLNLLLRLLHRDLHLQFMLLALRTHVADLGEIDLVREVAVRDTVFLSVLRPGVLYAGEMLH